jgi:fructose-specific phosphotransferase system IIC component
MKGSEYIAARAGISAAGFIAGGVVIAVTALWLVPLLMRGLEAVAPKLLPPIGGIIVGLAVVVLVAALMRWAVALLLIRFENWTIESGGIED